MDMDIKVGYSCEPYIQNCSNKHLRRIIAFGQDIDLSGLTSRLAGIKALRDRIEHAKCATIEC